MESAKQQVPAFEDSPATTTTKTTTIRTLVNQIHLYPYQLFVYLAGGASRVLGWLISMPRASTTVLEAVVPYLRMSMIQLPARFRLSSVVSKLRGDMALLAYNRALSSPEQLQSGLCLMDLSVADDAWYIHRLLEWVSRGSLTGIHPKHGEHKFHITTGTSNRSWLSVVTLSKGLRTREEEDEVSSQFLVIVCAANNSDEHPVPFTRMYIVPEQGISVLAYSYDNSYLCSVCPEATPGKIPTAFCADLTEFDMSNESEETFTKDEELEQLLNGDICFEIHIPQMQIERLYILSGSFNPLHEGHLKLLEVATSICGNGFPCFELSALNTDKPLLSVEEIKNRVKQFEKFGKTAIISNQPFFYKKAQLFSAFVISADTAVRLLNVLEDLDILDVLKDLFISIPAYTFCMDISSSEIRNRGAQ